MNADDDENWIEREEGFSAVQRASKQLLGRRYRLELAAHIATRRLAGVFTASGLASGTGLSAQQIHEEVDLLQKCGCLERLGRGPRNRVVYRALDNELWDYAQAAVARISRESESAAR